jgi:hypothetical protein
MSRKYRRRDGRRTPPAIDDRREHLTYESSMNGEDSPADSGAGQWVVAQGGDEKRPALIRVRTDLDPTSTGARWPNRLAVVWTYPLEGAEGQRGLPTGEQQAAMGRLRTR